MINVGGQKRINIGGYKRISVGVYNRINVRGYTARCLNVKKNFYHIIDLFSID